MRFQREGQPDGFPGQHHPVEPGNAVPRQPTDMPHVLARDRDVPLVLRGDPVGQLPAVALDGHAAGRVRQHLDDAAPYPVQPDVGVPGEAQVQRQHVAELERRLKFIGGHVHKLVQAVPDGGVPVPSLSPVKLEGDLRQPIGDHPHAGQHSGTLQRRPRGHGHTAAGRRAAEQLDKLAVTAHRLRAGLSEPV